MLPFQGLPLAFADRLLDESGRLTEQSDLAAKVDNFLPWSLAELVRYAAVLQPCGSPSTACSVTEPKPASRASRYRMHSYLNSAANHPRHRIRLINNPRVP